MTQATHNPPSPERPAVAIFTRYYLPISMTFVHRQLLGVSDSFHPVVCTSELSNRDVFPHDPVVVRQRSTWERVQGRIAAMARGRYAVLAGSVQSYWGRVFKEHDVRVVHAHFGPYALEVLPVAKRMGLPLVATFHGFGASVLLQNKRYVSQLRELFSYARVLAASRGTADRLLSVGAFPDRLSVHYIGIPVEVFAESARPSPADKLASNETVEFLQVSNFVEVKGHIYTIEAFAELTKTHPNCRLTFVGDGPTKGGIFIACQHLGISDKVRFESAVPTEQVARFMSEADIFLHHSVTPEAGDIEAATTVIAEAMSTGLIVIGSDHGGIPEMIDHGTTGFLVEERDIDGYVAAMKQSLECDTSIGRAASARIRSHFNLDTQNRALIDIYRDEISRA